MQYSNLNLLRELRVQEKALEARIIEVMPAAAEEAVKALASKGLDRGEFGIIGIGTFQLQVTDVFDFKDYNRYKNPEAVAWRAKNKDKEALQKQAKACTAAMNGFMKTFIELYPEKEPDEVKVVLKVITDKPAEDAEITI